LVNSPLYTKTQSKFGRLTFPGYDNHPDPGAHFSCVLYVGIPVQNLKAVAMGVVAAIAFFGQIGQTQTQPHGHGFPMGTQWHMVL
jgi:hypothetical protein